MDMKWRFKGIAKAVAAKSSCPICLNRLEYQTAAVIIPCMHAYCITCIRTWSHVKRKCPLCNSDFDSLFTKINFLSQTFHKEKLLSANKKKIDATVSLRRPIDRLADPRMIFRRRREEVNTRTRPLPWQRCFGQNDSAGRIMSWRASIYEERLEAVPFPSKNCLMQHMENTSAKEKMLRRIEPWIRRELQAILGDPDPSIIVHVVTSLFISGNSNSIGRCARDDFLASLRPFLHERAEMFWHELRCFAESPLSMQTYDAVVQYTSLTNSRVDINSNQHIDSNPGATMD